MGVVTAPRSVSDATRFTATTPHASSKAASPAAPAAGPGSRFAAPGARRIPRRQPSGDGPGGDGHVAETPEQRVARLRAAHLRAKEADNSKLADKVIAGGRRFFDSAHKITVFGLIGFSAIATLVTAYTAYDMMTFNRKRKAEFFEAQKKLEAESLEAARLAYMTGKATEEQIALVEEAIEREGGAGTSGPHILNKASGFGLSAPIQQRPEAAAQPRVTEAATWPGSAASEQATRTEQPAQEYKGGLFGWFSSPSKHEGQGEERGSGDMMRAVEDKQAYVRTRAREAFEKEKENRRKGGPLDQVGLDETAESQPPKKKGWLW